jgi:outer membrane protein W
MRKLGLVLALVVLVASIPVMADQGDKIIRFGVAYVSPSGDYTETFDDGLFFEKFTIEADGAIGPYFGFEFMVTDLIGIDATLLFTDHDVDAGMLEIYDGEVVFDEQMKIGTITSMPLFFSVHFHVVQNSALDFYIGPTIGYIFYGDMEFLPEFEEGKIPIKDDFGYGLVTGIDVPFGGAGWNFSTALRYILSDAETDEDSLEGSDDSIGIDPLILHVGVGKRW